MSRGYYYNSLDVAYSSVRPCDVKVKPHICSNVPRFGKMAVLVCNIAFIDGGI